MTPPPPFAAAAPPARGRRRAPSVPLPRRVVSVVESMGVAGAAHVLRYAPTEPPIPSPTFAPPQSATLLSFFLLSVNPLVVPRTQIRRLVLYPAESGGFVGLTLREFVGLDASPFGGEWRRFGDLGNVCS